MANKLSQRLAKQASGKSPSRYNPLQGREQTFSDIAIAKIKPDPKQPRKSLGDIAGLAKSITEYGVIVPIVVQPDGADGYQIIAGERRYSASKEAKLKAIPCIVRTFDEHRKLEVQLIENLHRKGLTPVEEAASYRTLIDDHRLSQRELSRKLGQSASGINQTLRILALPNDILESVQTSEHLIVSGVKETGARWMEKRRE